jgi:hypothetical protein
MDKLKLIVTVSAGTTTEVPMPEFTKRWTISAQEWYEASQEERRHAITGVQKEIAAHRAKIDPMFPNLINWVREDWTYL